MHRFLVGFAVPLVQETTHFSTVFKWFHDFVLTAQETSFLNSMLWIQTHLGGSGEEDAVREAGKATPVLLECSH